LRVEKDHKLSTDDLPIADSWLKFLGSRTDGSDTSCRLWSRIDLDRRIYE